MQPGEPLSAEIQRHNVQLAAGPLSQLASQRQLVVTHGNGPQVGLLALQSSLNPEDAPYPLDLLDAQTEGMIGYLIEQELNNRLPSERHCVTLLTQVEVDRSDPAFNHPTKPIGPVYEWERAEALIRERGWDFTRAGQLYRRVVPSPRPLRIVELSVIRLLISHQVIVICGGGGGIPVIRTENGDLAGIEAVIDKDSVSALLAQLLGANELLLLTDADAVYDDWQQPNARAIRQISPAQLRQRQFAEGSMAPKVAAACRFVEQTGGIAGIGRLQDAEAILANRAGTLISADVGNTVWWSADRSDPSV